MDYLASHTANTNPSGNSTRGNLPVARVERGFKKDLVDNDNQPLLFVPMDDALSFVVPRDLDLMEKLKTENPGRFGQAHWRGIANDDLSPRIYVPLGEYLDLVEGLVSGLRPIETAVAKLRPEVLNYYSNLNIKITTPQEGRRIIGDLLLFDDHCSCTVSHLCSDEEAWKIFSERILIPGRFHRATVEGKMMPNFGHPQIPRFDLHIDESFFRDGEFHFEMNSNCKFRDGAPNEMNIVNEMRRIFKELQGPGFATEIEFRPGVFVVPRASWKIGEAM